MNPSLVVEIGQSPAGRFVRFKGVALGDVFEAVLGQVVGRLVMRP